VQGYGTGTFDSLEQMILVCSLGSLLLVTLTADSIPNRPARSQSLYRQSYPANVCPLVLQRNTERNVRPPGDKKCQIQTQTVGFCFFELKVNSALCKDYLAAYGTGGGLILRYGVSHERQYEEPLLP